MPPEKGEVDPHKAVPAEPGPLLFDPGRAPPDPTASKPSSLIKKYTAGFTMPPRIKTIHLKSSKPEATRKQKEQENVIQAC